MGKAAIIAGASYLFTKAVIAKPRSFTAINLDLLPRQKPRRRKNRRKRS
jgi:hypothetical protein